MSVRAIGSGLQSGGVGPSPLGPAPKAQLRELNALRAFQEVPAERRVVEQVANEQFPFDLERVVVHLVGRDLLPGVAKVDRLRNVGIPHRLGRTGARLRSASRLPRAPRAQ